MKLTQPASLGLRGLTHYPALSKKGGISMSSTTLPQSISFKPYKVDEEKSFSDAVDLAGWLSIESEAWAEMPQPSANPARKLWGQQVTNIKNASAQAESLKADLESQTDENARRNIFNQFVNNFEGIKNGLINGSILTTDHPDFPHIRALANNDVEAAGMLFIACLNSAANYVSTIFNDNNTAIALLRYLLNPLKETPDYTDSIETFTKQLAQLKGSMQKEVETHRAINVEWEGFVDATARESNRSAEAKSSAWQEWLDSVGVQWKDRLKAYDEDMAYAAPITYWENRKESSRKAATTYAYAFAAAIIIPTALFLNFGIPHLDVISRDKEISVIAGLVPIIIPAFACVWLLRIIGRLLSENIQFMQDAGERVTMIKTFLALMKDDVSGKALITDQDRMLILPAIFRPSSITATDDAPPVHYLEVLTNKFGSSSGNKPG